MTWKWVVLSMINIANKNDWMIILPGWPSLTPVLQRRLWLVSLLALLRFSNNIMIQNSDNCIQSGIQIHFPNLTWMLTSQGWEQVHFSSRWSHSQMVCIWRQFTHQVRSDFSSLLSHFVFLQMHTRSGFTFCSFPFLILKHHVNSGYLLNRAFSPCWLLPQWWTFAGFSQYSMNTWVLENGDVCEDFSVDYLTMSHILLMINCHCHCHSI